ncbi:MAG TPA: cytochrome P450 [Rickettsia endosymbiont of Pyrocoelia pectoralis]|nr:cytochrome P450 [Rickettsia endosymbiont of Pyrocoelia pectoralis]
MRGYQIIIASTIGIVAWIIFTPGHPVDKPALLHGSENPLDVIPWLTTVSRNTTKNINNIDIFDWIP